MGGIDVMDEIKYLQVGTGRGVVLPSVLYVSAATTRHKKKELGFQQKLENTV